MKSKKVNVTKKLELDKIQIATLSRDQKYKVFGGNGNGNDDDDGDSGGLTVFTNNCDDN